MVLSCKVSTKRGGHHLQCGGGQIVLREEAVVGRMVGEERVTVIYYMLIPSLLLYKH